MQSPRRSSRRPSSLADASTVDSIHQLSSPASASRIILASKKNAHGNGNQPRRLEDFLDSTITSPPRHADANVDSRVAATSRPSSSSDIADDTFAAAIQKGIKRTAPDQLTPPSKGRANTTTTRAPRKTFNEEADASGFVFTVESRKPDATGATTTTNAQPSASSMGPPSLPVASRVREPLPSDTVGETPINRKNRLFRSGPLYPSTPASGKQRTAKGPPISRSSSASRRTSLNLKESRRSSSLRDGTPAYPHPGVPDKELYRHCADNIPPVARMTHLAAWTLERARVAVLESLPSASAGPHVGPKGKRAQKDQEEEGSSQWSPQERKLLERCRPSLEKVLLDTLKDLNGKSINISWLGVKKDSKAASSSAVKRNPRNEENRTISEQLSILVETLRAENTRWQAESGSVEAFERETAELNRVRANFTMEQLGSMASSDITAPPRLPVEDGSKSSSSAGGRAARAVEWDFNDLHEESKQMMWDAQRALAKEEGWLLPSSQDTGLVEVAVRAAAVAQKMAINGTTEDRRKSKVRSDESAKLLTEGSERDVRWKNFEFQTDLLRSYTHSLDRLNLLSSSYTSATSSRAAQALHQLAFASGDILASSSSTSTDLPGASGAISEDRQVSRERKEKLLRGIRESIGPVRRLELEAELRARGEVDEQMTVKAEAAADDSGIHLADQSAVDLFRAFASGTSTSRGRKSAVLAAARSSIRGAAASGRPSTGASSGRDLAAAPFSGPLSVPAPTAPPMRRTTGRKSRR